MAEPINVTFKIAVHTDYITHDRGSQAQGRAPRHTGAMIRIQESDGNHIVPPSRAEHTEAQRLLERRLPKAAYNASIEGICTQQPLCYLGAVHGLPYRGHLYGQVGGGAGGTDARPAVWSLWQCESRKMEQCWTLAVNKSTAIPGISGSVPSNADIFPPGVKTTSSQTNCRFR
jgi:hypothetical protein